METTSSPLLVITQLCKNSSTYKKQPNLLVKKELAFSYLTNFCGLMIELRYDLINLRCKCKSENTAFKKELQETDSSVLGDEDYAYNIPNKYTAGISPISIISELNKGFPTIWLVKQFLNDTYTIASTWHGIVCWNYLFREGNSFPRALLSVEVIKVDRSQGWGSGGIEIFSI